MQPLDRIKAYHDELTAWRRDIHAHPELGFEEQRTSEIVARQARGVRLRGASPASARPASSACCASATAARHRPARRHGRAADRRGQRPAATQSQHAGHDARLRPRRAHDDAAGRGHAISPRRATSTAPCISSSSRPRKAAAAPRRWSRTGCSSSFPCDSVFGMHNRPGLAVGKFAIRSGPHDGGRRVLRHHTSPARARMARGPRPASIRCSSPATSRRRCRRSWRATSAPLDTAVVSVTAIHAGDAYNVIPQTAVCAARCAPSTQARR